MNILGIDLSLNATGLAMLSIDDPNPVDLGEICTETARTKTFTHNGIHFQGCVVKPEPHSGTLERWETMLLPIISYAQHAHQVLIEGYAFSRQLQYTRALTEFGGIVRYHLRKIGLVPVEISPSSLKKFVCANGRAEKLEMLVGCVEYFGIQLSDHNMADAFGLAEIGRCIQLSDRAELHKHQREVIQIVKYPVVRPKKRKAPLLKFEPGTYTKVSKRSMA